MSDTPNKQLSKISTMVNQSKICKDFYTGTAKVMNTTYLPQWSGETDAGYDTRIATTAFANMYAPIVDGLVGMITRKEPQIVGYDMLDMDNVDLKNQSIAGFSKKVATKSIVDGIVFVTAEKNTPKNRIYLKMYEYENLMSYIVEDNILKQIVFKDEVEKQSGKFGLYKQERYIVFTIGGGALWYKKESEDTIKEQETWTNSLTEIPMVAIQTGKTLSDFEIIPKLLDTARLNKVHLNLESNIANVLGVVGNPIPIFYGQVSEGKVTIGVKDALVFDDKSKEGFEYGEITGAGVEKLQNKIKSVEEQIDKLTFSLLTKEQSKTVIEAQSNQSKNTSFLSDVAIELEVKFNAIFQMVVLLENKTIGADDKIDFKKDFDTAIVNLATAKELLLAGEMSRETFYHIMKTGELPTNFTAEDEANQIEKDLSTGTVG